jgi:hypothetical protein
MRMPGYTAEVGLHQGRSTKWSCLTYGPETVDQVVPQVSYRLCYKPETCIFRCCTTTITYEGPYHVPVVRTKCDPDSWICGHRRPDAGVFSF